MIKAVIFDLDGTLLNTLEDLANASNFALRSCGYNEHPIKDYIRFVGSGRYILMKRILPEEDKNNEEAIEKVLKLFDEYYGEHMHDTTKPYDGIYELIKELKIKNIKLAVVSNKPDEFAGETVNRYFGNDFEITYGQRPNHAVKPDPKTVYVDMKTAQNAGVKSIGVAWGFRGEEELKSAGADYIIRTPQELVNLL